MTGILHTERLILRHWREEDLPLFAAINASKEVCEFLPHPLTRDESDALAATIQAHFTAHGFGLFAVEYRKDATFIGFTGVSIPCFNAPFMPQVEIGWRLAHSHWGKGFATEAAHAVCS